MRSNKLPGDSLKGQVESVYAAADSRYGPGLISIRAALVSVRMIHSHGQVCGRARHSDVTIGVEDLVIVHSPDATLVCRKSEAAALRELVDIIRAEYGERYT